MTSPPSILHQASKYNPNQEKERAMEFWQQISLSGKYGVSTQTKMKKSMKSEAVAVSRPAETNHNTLTTGRSSRENEGTSQTAAPTGGVGVCVSSRVLLQSIHLVFIQANVTSPLGHGGTVSWSPWNRFRR